MSGYDFYKLLVFVILFSAVIGAYCTTIDYRIRQDLPLITRDCFCPSCGHRLSILQQIPVASWLFLRGRCYYCHSVIPLRYPLIEIGFIAYYSLCFWLFRRHFMVYVTLWLLFLTVVLCLRSKNHFRSLAKGLSVMYLYHLVFAAVLYVITSALNMPSA